MVGFLKTIESPAGQTIGVIRENGQVEDCAVVDPADIGGGAPLPDALYVAQGAAAGGNGAIGTPFNTLAAGLVALANLAVDFPCLLIEPADYSAEGVLHWIGSTALMLKGYSAGVPFPDPFLGPNPQVQLPSITADTGFPDLYLDNVTLALSQQFNNFTNIFGVGCELQSVITAGDLQLRNSRMLGSMSVGGNVRLWNCETQTDTNWNVGGTSIEFVGTKITAFSAPIVFTGSAGVVTVDDFSNFYFAGIGIAITNGTKTVAGEGPPPGFAFELTATGPAAGASEPSTAAVISGAPFAPGVGFILACVVQWNAQAPGYIEAEVKLQFSSDGGAVWNDVTTATKVSQTIAANPTFMQASCFGFMSALGNAVSMQARFLITNAAGSAGALFNVSGQVTALACTG